MSKQLYISDENRKYNQTPKNDFDPRYYDLCYCNENGYWNEEPDPEVIEYINDEFGEDSYRLIIDGVIYTEDYDVMMFLQEETIYTTPVWFDIVEPDKHIADELYAAGWTW